MEKAIKTNIEEEMKGRANKRKFLILKGPEGKVEGTGKIVRETSSKMAKEQTMVCY